MNRSVIILYICLSICFCSYLNAQNVEIKQDFSTWIGLRIEKKLPNNFEFSLEQQLRTWKNATKIDKYWATLGLNYKVNKNFELNGELRYIHSSNKWLRPQNSLRYALGIQFRCKIGKKIKLFYRLQYQQKFTHNHRAFTFEVNSATRHKVKVQLKHKKNHRFYFATELFIRSNLGIQAHLDKQRLSFGHKIKTKVGDFNSSIGCELNIPPKHFYSLFFVKIVYTISL